MYGDFDKCNFCRVRNFRGIAICIDMRHDGKCPDIIEELVIAKAKELNITPDELLQKIN